MRVRRPTLLLLIVCGILLLSAGLAVAWRLQHRIIVVNMSGQRLETLSVSTRTQTITFVSVPDSTTVSAPFSVQGDSSYRLVGRLADGTEISAKHGYVTGGMTGVRAGFAIRPDGSSQHWQTTWP